MEKKSSTSKVVFALLFAVVVFALGIGSGLLIMRGAAPEGRATAVASNTNVNGSGSYESELEDNEMRIPGYYEVYASAEKPEIELFNPPDNTVYFVYDVKDAKTQETVYRSLIVEPGMADMWNAYEQLSPEGTRDLDLLFVIETYEPAAEGGEDEHLRNINQNVVCHIYTE